MKLALAALSVAALAQAQSSVDPPDFVPTQLQAPLLEQFTDSWEERWSPSHATKKSPVGSGETFSYVGVWSVEEPTVYPGFKGDKGLVMKSKAAHHAISAPVPGGLKVADGRPLVVQYETKLQKGLECGGAYMKLLSEDPAASGEEFSDKTPFTIMFGPDKCGATNKVHFIFRHRHPVTGEYEEKHLEATPSPKITKTTALYTLIVNPDDTFEIKINDESVQTGSLASSFLPAVHPPRTIADPSSTKPSTWVDDETIPDPDAVKPADWDEEAPALIVDPTATMPEGWLVDEPPTVADPEAIMPDEWDEEEDGDWLAPSVPNPLCEEAPGCGPWTAPRIPNPAFKGVWTAPRVPNPAFVGVWQPEQVPNPAFFEPGPIATGLDDIQSVGLELWTMTDDMLFDNIYLGHSVADAEALAQETFHRKLALERAAETHALEDEEEDEREQVKKLTDGSGKGIGGVVGRAVGAVKGRFDETIETFPHFVELLKDDWRAALATYPTFITTVAASILALVTLFSTLLALLSESPKPAVATTTTTHTKPTTASKKRVVEGVELAPVVLEAEVVVPPAVAGGAGGEQGKSSAVEVGGDGGEIKVRKTTTTTTAK